MKDILDEESRQVLIKYRMERAYDSMKEAQLMAEKSFYNAAINRLYYACYYAAVALLLTGVFYFFDILCFIELLRSAANNGSARLTMF